MYIQCINGDNEILLQLVQLQAMTCTIMCVLFICTITIVGVYKL